MIPEKAKITLSKEVVVLGVYPVINPDCVLARKITQANPGRCSGDISYSGSAQMAANVIGALDRVYTREQVHEIAYWILYLSTQS